MFIFLIHLLFVSNHASGPGSGTAMASAHESSARVVTQTDSFKANVHALTDCYGGAKKDAEDGPDVPHR